MIFEIAHQIGLVPVVALVLWGRQLPAKWWLFGLALGVSWVADSAQAYAGGVWGTWYVFLPVQLALAFAAYTDSAAERVAGAAFVGVLAASSAWLTYPGLDWLGTAVGSVLILFYALERGPLWVPGFVYFGLGTLAYLGIALRDDANFMPWWYAYQACRLVAIVWFCSLVYRERPA